MYYVAFMFHNFTFYDIRLRDDSIVHQVVSDRYHLSKYVLWCNLELEVVNLWGITTALVSMGRKVDKFHVPVSSAPFKIGTEKCSCFCLAVEIGTVAVILTNFHKTILL